MCHIHRWAWIPSLGTQGIHIMGERSGFLQLSKPSENRRNSAPENTPERSLLASSLLLYSHLPVSGLGGEGVELLVSLGHVDQQWDRQPKPLLKMATINKYYSHCFT
jgi:hypothetical protein